MRGCIAGLAYEKLSMRHCRAKRDKQARANQSANKFCSHGYHPFKESRVSMRGKYKNTR